MRGRSSTQIGRELERWFAFSSPSPVVDVLGIDVGMVFLVLNAELKSRSHSVGRAAIGDNANGRDGHGDVLCE